MCPTAGVEDIICLMRGLSLCKSGKCLLCPHWGGGGGILCLHGGVSCAHKGSVLCPHGEYLVPPLVHTGGVSHTHRRDSIVCTGECLHVLCAQAKIVLASVCPHIHASQSWEEQMVTLQQMTFDIM